MTKLEHFMHLIARDLSANKLTIDDALRMIRNEAPSAETEEGRELLSVLRYVAQYDAVVKSSAALGASFDSLGLWSDAVAAHEDGKTAAQSAASKLFEETRRTNDLLADVANNVRKAQQADEETELGSWIYSVFNGEGAVDGE